MDKELKACFDWLEQSGLNPQLCNLPVPYYDSGVRAGIPATPGDPTRGEYFAVPEGLSVMQPTFVVNVAGDSMQDADIRHGDLIWVKVGVHVNDGDIVLVSIAGECTVKALFTDENGCKWLIPYNERYDAIRLTEDMDVHIVGLVVAVVRQAPHTSYQACSRILKRTLAKYGGAIGPNREQAYEAIRQVAPLVKTARQWYAVFRTLADAGVLAEGAYLTCVEWVHHTVPRHPHLPTARELRRMAVQSFSKPVERWNRDNAPVSGQRYDDYLQVARCTAEWLKRPNIRHESGKMR